jgi:serine protease Do
MRELVLLVAWLAVATAAAADDRVVKLAARLKGSVLTVTADRREETKQGVGAGFVVGPGGLVATNAHVVGQGRPIDVRSADGTRHEVVEVVAHDRDLDLAVIRIKTKSLKALKLGDSDQLAVGAEVMAIGNPIGMEASIVTGVVSGRRRMEGREMIQVAIPIEHGNSGGPLVDMEGRVHGVITLKSALTANLGFAVTANQLTRRLAKPRPVPIAKWLAQHAPDPAIWRPRLGARWRQKANSLTVDGEGSGHGGRSLAFRVLEPPEPPYEIGVWVKLRDEGGAAGLAFLGQSQDDHYGFYPSRGKMRLTRFAGPEFRDWKILSETASRQWRPGDWNHLKVVIEKTKIVAFVNDVQVAETTSDKALAGKLLGVVKFRDTRAEFRDFAVARQIAPVSLAAEVIERVTRLAAGAVGLPPGTLPPVPVMDALVPEAPGSVRALRERARTLEAEAAALKGLARAVHEKAVRQELVRLLELPDEKVDLVQVALLVARLDADDLDIEPYREAVNRMAAAIVAKLPKGADDAARLAALDAYMFEEAGFRGSKSDYYSKENSYLNEVIDEREGLPLTLSILYIELARRLGVKVGGVPLPGHFVVEYKPASGPARLIDVFEGGKPTTRRYFETATKRAIVLRMLHNLLAVAHSESDTTSMLRYLDTLIDLETDPHEERWTRAWIHAHAGRLDAARADLDWLIEKQPRDLDVKKVQELRKSLDR